MSELEAVTKIANRTEKLAIGRTSSNRAKAIEAIQSRVSNWSETVRDPIDLCIRRGAKTLREVADCMNTKGVPTSRGGQWSPMQISRVMKSLSLTF